MNDYDIFGLQPIFIITIFSSDEAILHLIKANFPPATWSSFKNIAKSLIKCLIDQKSQRPLFEGSKCICHCHCLCLCLCGCLFVGQVMFSHHSDQMSQRSKVSKIALWRCSLNVFVIVFVFVFFRCLFVGQVMFSHQSDHMSQRSKVSNIAEGVL